MSGADDMRRRRRIGRKPVYSSRNEIAGRRRRSRLRQDRGGRKRRAAQHAMEFARCGRGRIAVRRRRIAAAKAQNRPPGDISGLCMGGNRRKGREQGLQRNGVSRDQSDRRPEPRPFPQIRHSNPNPEHPYQR